MVHAADDVRRRALEVLKAWGSHATSFQILEPGYTYWFDDRVPEPGAVVAYVRHGRQRVVAGVPIAPEDAVGEVTARFVADAGEHGETCLFFSADEPFLDALRALDGGPDFDAVKIGEQPEWDPRRWTTAGRARRSLRAQVNRARNKGVTVRRVGPEELATARGPLRAEVEAILRRWLATHRMSVMGFMVDLHPFHFAEERRYYVAERGDRPLAFLAAIPVYERGGWFFEDIIRVPDAPNGTVELMVDTAMRDAAERDDSYVTLGLAPLAGIPTEPGPHRLLRRSLRLCHDRLGALYSFRGIYDFKRRLHPERWQAQYLVAVPPPVGLRSFQAVLRAFAEDGLGTFVLDSLRRLLARVPVRAWAALIFTLAAFLVPWTLLLALADGRYWFGDVSTQWAWVSFDAAMVVGLAGLGDLVRRGLRVARPVAFVLAGAAGADFVLTAVQAFHLHHDVTGWQRLFVTAGMAGPLLATLLLTTVALVAPLRRRHRRRRRDPDPD